MERLWRKRKYGDAANPDPITGLGYDNHTCMADPFNQEEVELTLDDINVTFRHLQQDSQWWSW